MGFGPIISFTFGVFLKSLSQEFGWSRAQISLAFSLSVLVGSGILPLIGNLVDRFGARKVIVPSVLFFGLGVMSFSLLSASLWHFYASYLFLGIVGGGTTPLPYASVISHWFDKRRGLALGLTMVGLGLGTFYHALSGAGPHHPRGLAPRLCAPRPHGHRRRHPNSRAVSQRNTTDAGAEPDGETAVHAGAARPNSQESGLSGREAWYTSTFWLMLGAFFLVSASVHGCLISPGAAAHRPWHLCPERGLGYITARRGGAVGTRGNRVFAGPVPDLIRGDLFLLRSYFGDFSVIERRGGRPGLCGRDPCRSRARCGRRPHGLWGEPLLWLTCIWRDLRLHLCRVWLRCGGRPAADGNEFRRHRFVPTGAVGVCSDNVDSCGVNGPARAVSGMGASSRTGSRNWCFTGLKEEKWEEAAVAPRPTEWQPFLIGKEC